MIDPKELRLFNLVHSEHPSFTNIYDKQLAVGTIDSFDHGTVWIKEYHNEMSYKHIHPIPITPEWLERLGAIKSHDDSLYFSIVPEYDYPADNIELTWTPGMRLQMWAGNDDNGLIIEHVRYVHQLQNLIFALTGEELTIKP